jgi:hypothetical protein
VVGLNCRAKQKSFFLLIYLGAVISIQVVKNHQEKGETGVRNGSMVIDSVRWMKRSAPPFVSPYFLMVPKQQHEDF